MRPCTSSTIPRLTHCIRFSISVSTFKNHCHVLRTIFEHTEKHAHNSECGAYCRLFSLQCRWQQVCNAQLHVDWASGQEDRFAEVLVAVAYWAVLPLSPDVVQCTTVVDLAARWNAGLRRCACGLRVACGLPLSSRPLLLMLCGLTRCTAIVLLLVCRGCRPVA